MGVRITGMGIVSAIGLTVAENLQALMESRSGIEPVQFLKEAEGLLVGEVKMSNEALQQALDTGPKGISRTSLLGLKAAKEAWGDNKHVSGLRTGIISATSVGGMDRTEDFYKSYLAGTNPDFNILKTHDSGSTTERIAAELGISGYINTLSTACSSGANAIMLGARLLLNGKLDRVLVGGSDAITRFTINGFRSLMIYDDAWCRPFDESRSGLNLGEGAAFLLLENEKSVQISGNKTIGYVSGWANAADAYHQTASSPEGKGATLAIKNALTKSGVALSDISYINAHGTGTKNNDLSESVALMNVFGNDIPAFSSTKPYTGHTLAAAGAIEAVFSVLAIQRNLIFPNLNYKTPITETGLNPVTSLQSEKAIKAVLSNSFGFGGNNSSLVFSSHN
ncbi:MULTISPECIES: beta-ketoacyl synthase [Dyadobacter]|uniref:Beta-ketoacyl-[acyl-carrier-protein] synthase family protein n=1 Tax=Dyadobacter chenhuakuii TaxID=2909339 RepID=A0ABY4XRK6_9BACT|nr:MULTISPECIES: beta-ketoacyl-[acyl-carrier-protein] synthase family protein [Dyadobacter]MCF2492781.1 beta-ketoacyl-[acyl-carrier-protein] synthase family protein [Dyadobacter chenhuakuii]MCF2520844.1 beta-ketoacyl-[acyl-carrier-protein] synthase family protein [Dyadobacter sp. CY351]USJ32928.1 beta-ketoacyl-[acyl-carrier-protein] synthase family protein [Dyadobacter chenhuakuii]